MRPAFIVNYDGLIQKIADICTCDKCKERGMLEFRVEDLEGEYVDYIKFDELKHHIKNISYYKAGLTHKNNLYGIIAMMLHDKLLEMGK